MKKRRKLNREQLGFIILLAVAVLSFWVGGTKLTAQASGGRGVGSTHQLTLYDTRYNDGPLMVGYFEIDGGISAMCICHEMDPPTQLGTVFSVDRIYTGENRNNDIMRKICYYGWQGPGDVGASYVETCLAGSVANGHRDNYYGYGQAFIDRIQGLPDAPEGFSVYVLSDGGSTTQDLAFWEYEPTGWLQLKKSASKTELVKGNGCYTLEGAEYGVFSEEACRSRQAVLVTNAEGITEAVELDAGTYYVKEIKAPAGYQLDQTVYPVALSPQETQNLEVGEVPVWDGLGLMIQKQDAESKEGHPLGGASLEGAEFKVCYYKGNYTVKNLPEKPDRTWVLAAKEEKISGETKYVCRLDKKYQIEGDAFYEVDGKPVLPLGTLTVEEVKAPKGYLTDGMFFQNNTGKAMKEKYLTTIRQDGNTAVMAGGNVCTASDYVIRGDLELVKIAEGTHKRLANVPFQITSKTTLESHIIITDENGQISTSSDWNKHSTDTNLGETCDDGIWFGIGANGVLVTAENTKGALPFDTYEIEEIRCASNEDYDLIPPFTVTIKKNKAIVHLGTLTDKGPEDPGEPEKHEEPEVPEEPEKPEEPGEPEKPEKPEEPKKPEESEKPEAPQTIINTRTQAPVRTGDAADISIWLFTCILSCAVIITCGMIARRMKKR